MKSFKNYAFLGVLAILSVLIACNHDDDHHHHGPATPQPANDPPSGWRQKVNNKLIGRVTLEGIGRNCARTTGRNIECPEVMDSIPENCFLFITYLDETPREKWQKDCNGGTLMFDDGSFSYFYGTKSNP